MVFIFFSRPAGRCAILIIQTELYKQSSYVREFLLYGKEDALAKTDTTKNTILSLVEELLDNTRTAETIERLNMIKSGEEQYHNILDRAAETVRRGDPDAAYTLLTSQATPLLTEMIEAAEGIAQREIALDSESRTALLNTARNLQLIVLGMIVAAVVGGVILSLLVARAIVRPIIRLEQTVTRMANEHDLTVDEIPVTSADEVGRTTAAFNKMLAVLRQILQEIRTAADAVMSASQQLSAAAEQSAKAAEESSKAIAQVAESSAEQATSTAQANQLVEQLRTAIDQIAVGANRSAADVQQAASAQTEAVRELEEMARIALATAKVASGTAQQAESAATVVQRALKEINQVVSVFGQSAARIQELDRLSEQIGSITDVTLPTLSPESPIKPTYWPSMQPSRPLGQATTGGGLLWWPTRCVSWPSSQRPRLARLLS